MGRFYLKTQNIQINPESREALRNAMLQRKREDTPPPPAL
jgi:hypothetical protein